MFTRRIRIQLMVFAVVSVLGVVVVAVQYVNLPRLLGFGQYRVAVQFDNAAGLYPGGEVTYRGAAIGKISKVALDANNVATAELAIDDDVLIPRDLTAHATMMSAVGEQYIDLVPRRPGPPYLQPGAVIPPANSTELPSTAELLDATTDLLASVPTAKLAPLLDEVRTAFAGAGPDLQLLLNSGQNLLTEASQNLGPTTSLINQAGPFLETVLRAGPDLRSSADSLAAVTGQLRRGDSDLRGLLDHGPDGLAEATDLIELLRPDLPHLLSDLTDTGTMFRTYLPAIRQILVIYPAVQAATQATISPRFGDPGTWHIELRPNLNQPPICTRGFLPAKDWRDVNDLTNRKLPNDLYCHVPHSDSREVRGAHNLPCLIAPGKRAASVEECLGRPIGSIRRLYPETGGGSAPGAHDQPAAASGTEQPVPR